MIIIRKFDESEDNQLISLYIDYIDSTYEDKDFERMKTYQKKLLDRFGIDYDPSKQESEKPVTLDHIYKKKDFHFYKDWLKYVDNLFTLRFNTYKRYLSKKYDFVTISYEDIQDFFFNTDYEVSYEYNRSSTNIAYVSFGTKKIIFNFSNEYYKGKQEIGINTLIHELGHVFEHEYPNIQYNYADELAYCSTNYNMNPSEVFAENFKNFFLQPEYLNKGWKEVYRELDKTITKNWKQMISIIIQGVQ